MGKTAEDIPLVSQLAIHRKFYAFMTCFPVFRLERFAKSRLIDANQIILFQVIVRQCPEQIILHVFEADFILLCLERWENVSKVFKCGVDARTAVKVFGMARIDRHIFVWMVDQSVSRAGVIAFHSIDACYFAAGCIFIFICI